MDKFASVVLAAGKGTRMRSKTPKVLHHIAGKPLLSYVLSALQKMKPDFYQNNEPPIIVASKELLFHNESRLFEGCKIVVQEQQLGTGHALLSALISLKEANDNTSVIVVNGDCPLITTETLSKLLKAHKDKSATVTFLSSHITNPSGYGRVIRSSTGCISAIVEESDCSQEQSLLDEVNLGVYCFDLAFLADALPRLQPHSSGELYLTDLIYMAGKDEKTVATVDNPYEETMGVNDRVQLAQAESAIRRRIHEKLMYNGVTIVDPSTTYIDSDVEIGQDTIIHPFTLIRGKTVIGTDCSIGPYTLIENSSVGNKCIVLSSQIEESKLAENISVGPFSHLRANSELAESVHIGNFAEVKNSSLGPGSRSGHFSYLGDARIGSDVNIGAGTVTCNYDGENKYPTIIGDHVFIGSDSMLVAPVTINTGAKTGAGSVVTRDVPENSLALGVPARIMKSDGKTSSEKEEK